MTKKYFSLAFVFALFTWLVSVFVAFKNHGTLFATVSSEEILHFGAVDGSTLNSGEIWRILTSQLLHSKQAHMTFNIILGWLLGSSIEQRFGSLRFAAIYWLSGSIGILTSVLFYPQYVSSGSSQALMAMFACILVLYWKGFKISKAIFSLAIAGLFIQLSLDIYVNHLPKAGHVAGFLVGGVLSFVFSLKEFSKVQSSLIQA
ncbi:MAG: rhomboid family intramembrane serine protease [Pseudobdellovibrionaceae bacterium]